MEAFTDPIFVTRPYLPDLKQYQDGIAEIWKSQWLTNDGPVLKRYSRNLEKFFGTSNVCAFSNGTLALQIALQAMEISGEVITTPFTFVATAHALSWNKIKPVFVDIDPISYTIDPGAVELAITPRTTAILAVHVFGNLCNLKALQEIANRHHLKLIYDAAHAFGVDVDGQSIGCYGDCSMFSLHSTKLYHSIEGGVLVFRDPKNKKLFEYLRNFGFEDEVTIVMIGINAKMNEMQALMGDLMLPDLPKIIAKRRELTQTYFEGLSCIPGIDTHSIKRSLTAEDYTANFAYLPIEVFPEYSLSRDEIYERLKSYNVFARRYFYPLVPRFDCYKEQVGDISFPVAEKVADRILTLPIYFDLTTDDVCKICEIIRTLR